MKKYIFILLIVLIGNNFKSNAQGYVTGPENVTVGISYTYYTPEAAEGGFQYRWNLYAPIQGFSDSLTVSNTITLTFYDPGRYFLQSNTGIDLQIWVTDNGYAIATPRLMSPNYDFNFINQTKKGDSRKTDTPFIAVFKVGTRIPTDNLTCIFSSLAILPNSKMWDDESSSV